MANTLLLRFSSIFSLSSQTVDVESDGEDGVSILNLSVPNATTDMEVVFPVDKDLCKLLVITSDRAITVETNDGSTPDDTFNVVTTAPTLYYPGIGYVLTADIASLFITNSSGGTATVKIRAAQDVVP